MRTEDLPICTLERFLSDDDGTRGWLTGPLNLFRFASGELPYRDIDGDGVTDSGLSCAPRGIFVVEYKPSPSRKNKDGSAEWSYRLRDVPGRAGVLIHAGNFFGDKKLDRVAQVEGCILLGREHVDMLIPPAVRERYGVKRTRQPAVTASGPTIAEFVKLMDQKPFLLHIKGVV